MGVCAKKRLSNQEYRTSRPTFPCASSSPQSFKISSKPIVNIAGKLFALIIRQYFSRGKSSYHVAFNICMVFYNYFNDLERRLLLYLRKPHICTKTH
jgi:hypothetical protein